MKEGLKAGRKPGVLELRMLIKEEDLDLLAKLRDFIDNLIETAEIMADEELLSELKEALDDVRKGRLTRWEDFLKELKKEGQQ